MQDQDNYIKIGERINISECLHISIDYLIFGQRFTNSTNSNNSNELYSLLNRCSKKEISFIRTIIEVILPHISR